MADDNISDQVSPIARRNFLLGAGTAVAAGVAPPVEAQTQHPAPAAPPEPETRLTLTETEYAFFAAAAIIPADELSPSGSECGFFAGPIYGGNRNMAAWKMIGYPDLPATYGEDIEKYFGRKYDKPPRSIADFF